MVSFAYLLNFSLTCLQRTLKSASASVGHQASIFKIPVSFHIQLCPMAFGSARGEALHQPPVGKPLQSRIYPPETKSLFNHFNVWNSRPFRLTFAAVSHYPTTFLFGVVLFKPKGKHKLNRLVPLQVVCML